MKNIFIAVNIALILTIAALATLATRTWLDPKYPDRVDVNSVAHVPKTLEPLLFNRKFNNAGIINQAVQGNLFRKERREFSSPVQVTQATPNSASSALPPPDLKLKGVMLLGSKKIAIMEGNYPVREGGQAIRKKPLKRKGYTLGSKIGDFELTKIEKTKVSLNNNRGVILNLNLAQRPDDKVIQKVGNTLIQKNKNFDPGKIKKASRPKLSPAVVRKKPIKRPKPVQAPRTFRISGAPTNFPALKPHVSGR